MKPFRERNPIIIGTIGVTALIVIVVGGFNFTKLPLISSDTTYSAYFEDAGGLTTGGPVQVSGLRAGLVKSISLKPQGVLVEFTVADDIRLGPRTEAAIKTIGLLGNKILAVTPRGDGRLADVIPIERTTSPYQLPDAVGDLTATISGLNTDQLSESLQTLSETLRDTPPDLKAAVDGVARFSQTLSTRDEQLRGLLANARKATTVLAERSDQIAGLIHDTNALLTELRTQSAALDEISGNLSAMAQQIRGLIDEQRDTLKPALDKLNGVLAIVDNRKAEVQESLKGLNNVILALGESVSGGPFFKAYIANLLPGQFVQPFVDAAFSDLGLDPNVLAPSERHDPQIGQPGTPALPVPYPRTGQGGEPNLTLPDAITGNPGDQGCGPPGLPLPGPTGCYPYREPLPAPPPGGPPPGPPAVAPPGQQHIPEPTPSSIFLPAPGEVGHAGTAGGGQR
ncbi:mammalian cell entry protein [Mycolicibacterium novocastrense]|uniref:MCE family protein n=1 Tax=Mycolicibacterium novocastrense TaxID=59813 RepID=UPI000748715D|nr:MCE family protein [Mycolicibacterium novocastrense]KUH66973.1 mammalian cell entry protein [Mycolicibacterium novocastrense]KUH71412.1 mammalian cell entry protein [Mycolicibacterium novocastrense]KUH74464.1 mammalian cell entry protein [Mycolicibacterium novocastrense]